MFIHSFGPFLQRLFKSATTQKRSRHSTDTVREFHAEPTTLRSKDVQCGGAPIYMYMLIYECERELCVCMCDSMYVSIQVSKQAYIYMHACVYSYIRTIYIAPRDSVVLQKLLLHYMTYIVTQACPVCYKPPLRRNKLLR